jgi:hypothetical protein
MRVRTTWSSSLEDKLVVGGSGDPGEFSEAEVVGPGGGLSASGNRSVKDRIEAGIVQGA